MPGGEILFDGKPYMVSNPKEAMDMGVAMIHPGAQSHLGYDRIRKHLRRTGTAQERSGGPKRPRLNRLRS